MNLSSRQLVVGGGLLAYTWLLACGGPEEFRSGDAGLTGVGGSIVAGSGGAGPGPGSGGARTGGAPETGGRGTGGAIATGGRSASSGGATETGGRGSGGSGTGGRATGGADTGSGGRNTGGAGGRGTGGRATGGSATGGRSAGGSGTGGRAAGGATGTGGVTGTGPCAGLCSNPITVPKGTNSGGLGTGVTCHQVTSMVQGIVCGNFTAPRTFSVNDAEVNCTGNVTPPALRNGGYCMQATAGQTSSAYFTTF